MGRPTDSITVYSDYVCPFCYLGRQSLDQFLEQREQNLSIDWQPFDLRSQKRGPNGEIDHSVEDGKDESYYDQVRQNVARLRDAYEADSMLQLDDLPEHVDSFDAQVASFYAKEEYPDKWLAFDEAIFEALWIEGRDIGDVVVITEIAEAVGLDEEAIRTAISDDDRRDRLREKFEAAQKSGITGVPTFTYEEHAARGAVPPDHFERLVEGV